MPMVTFVDIFDIVLALILASGNGINSGISSASRIYVEFLKQLTCISYFILVKAEVYQKEFHKLFFVIIEPILLATYLPRKIIIKSCK